MFRPSSKYRSLLFGKRSRICDRRRINGRKSSCNIHSEITTAKFSSGAGYGNVEDRMLPTCSREERQQLFRHCQDPKTVSIIGAPMTFGQPFVGTDSSPSLLRSHGLLSKLSSLGWRVEDLPDLSFQLNNTEVTPNAKNCKIVGDASLQLANLVTEKIREGRFPLILGGDHSISIGSLSGVLAARPQTGVLWIDAHADINTPHISESGNMHGMPVGLVMEGSGVDFGAFEGLEWMEDSPKLAPDSIVYVGLRDVDMHERTKIHDLGIKAFTMFDIDRYGIGEVMNRALHHLLQHDPNRPIHLSYDIDAVDPKLAPATGTAVRGGLTFREAHFVAEAAAASGVLASVDLVELNTSLMPGNGECSGAGDTLELGLQIITSLMGKSII